MQMVVLCLCPLHSRQQQQQQTTLCLFACERLWRANSDDDLTTRGRLATPTQDGAGRQQEMQLLVGFAQPKPNTQHTNSQTQTQTNAPTDELGAAVAVAAVVATVPLLCV